MNNENRLTARQLMILVLLFSVGTTILVVPTVLAADAKQDAWIPGLVGVGVGLIFLWLYGTLAKKYPGYTLFDINDLVLGKWLGRMVTFFLVFAATVLSAQVLHYIGAFMTRQIMPTTPIQAINVLMITFVIIGAKSGVIVLGRTAEIFFPWILLLLFLFVIFLIPQAHVKNIMPIGEAGFTAIARASMVIVSFSYFPIILTLCLIATDAQFPSKITKAFIYGGIASGVIMFVIALLSILVLGADQSARHLYSTYALAKKISVGNFLQRIEVTVAFLWFISIYFKLTLYFHVIIKGLSSLFQLRNYKSLSTPTGIIVTVLSLVVYPNTAYDHHWDELTWLPLALCFGLIHPVLLLGISYLRGKYSRDV
jgi:spore germination protein KB